MLGACSPLMASGDFGFKSSHKLGECDSEFQQNRPELHDIQPAVPAFDFAHKRLSLTKSFGKLHLRDVGFLPCSLQ